MVWAIIIISLTGVCGLVTIEIFRPTDNNLPVIAILLGFLSPTIAAVLSLLKSQENANRLDHMHGEMQCQTDKLNFNTELTKRAVIASETAVDKVSQPIVIEKT